MLFALLFSLWEDMPIISVGVQFRDIKHICSLEI